MKKNYNNPSAFSKRNGHKKKEPIYETPEQLSVCLSGGLDSAVALASILQGYPGIPCTAISFMYPSKHNALELASACLIAEHYKVAHTIINVDRIFEDSSSSMIDKDIGIPEGHYESNTMESTVVPLRNIIFTSIAAAKLMNMFPNQRVLLCVGMHSGDHYIYPDCRPATNQGLAYTLMHGSDAKIALNVPFLNGDKKQIVLYGAQLGVPFELTRTCYTSNVVACGKCGSCQERLEAFSTNMLDDPLKYQQDEIVVNLLDNYEKA